jgi:hypothetical protein
VEQMSYSRIALAGLGATVAYFVAGGLLFALLPRLRDEFRKYPAVYRTEDGIKAAMPVGMVAMFLSILMLAVIYAMTYRNGGGVVEGVRFGVLVGIFSVGAFVLHNYVNLNIGAKITTQQSLAYLFEWTVVGTVIGLIYRPSAL